jgi:hypothetical protein
MKAKSGAHQGVTVMMKRPEGKEATEQNAGGLHNLKRSQFEGIADSGKRAVRGNTFTYLVVALATVVENLRQIISFFERQLAIVTLNAKNHKQCQEPQASANTLAERASDSN